MKKQIKFSVALAAAVLLNSLAFGATELPKSLVKMKTGACEFTVFHSDGIKPAKDINIQILPANTKNSAAISGATTDKNGLVRLNVVENGRYILSVNDTHVALLQTSADENMSAYRLVLPATGLIVGGAEGDLDPEAPAGAADEAGEEEEDEEVAAGAKKKKAAVIAAAVIAGAIILIADDDDDDNTPTATTPDGTEISPALLDLGRVPDDVRAAYANGNDSLQQAILSDIAAGGSGRAPVQRASAGTPPPPPPATSTPRTTQTLGGSTPPPPPPPAPSSP